MAHDKIHITSANIDEWLSSTGFLFPRNELELARFDKLYAESLDEVTGKEIDPDRIINNVLEPKQDNQVKSNLAGDDFATYRMAARNGNNIPKHILEKMKRNQNNSRDASDGSSEEKDN